jgi:hypothetical protein
MIDPRTLEPKTNNRNALVSFLALWKKQFNDMLVQAFRKETLNVEVKNNAEQIFLAKQLLRQMELMAQLLKQTTRDPKVKQQINLKTTDLVSLNREIERLLKEISGKELKVIMPQIQKIFGKVEITNQKEYPSLSKIETLLNDVRNTIASLNLTVPPFPEIKQPIVNIPPIPKSFSVNEMKELIKEVKTLQKEIKAIPDSMPEVMMPDSIAINNFPPQKVPNPVTNININPLRGEVMTRTVTVGSTRVPLPGEVLSNRRAVIIFNNDNADTVYIGGANVTASDGLPVLPQTYSPALDAGPRMILYGLTSSGTADVRVMEISNENIGG